MINIAPFCRRVPSLVGLAVFRLWSAGYAAEQAVPTQANIPYGSHPRQVMDLYQAHGGTTPAVFFIHGGGWGALDKTNVARMLGIPRLLSNGISVVAINYRFIQHAKAAGIHPPVKWPLEDAARALQFLRFHADKWKIDKERIGACGGSAGACSSLWLAMHGDMAVPDHSDPVARESTRLFCAAVVGAQTTLDPKAMREWMPNISYGGHAFGLRTDGKDKAAEFQLFYAARDELLPYIREYSPLEHASADDPPLWLSYSQEVPAVKGEEQKDPTHSAIFGLMLEEKLRPLGVEMILTYPARPAGPYKDPTDYLVQRLKAEPAKPARSRSAVNSGWRLQQQAGAWQLLKDGSPFYLRGAVAPNRFPLLKASGGNAVRCNASQAALDAAQAAGLVVMANLPVRGERNGLDWDDAQQTAAQKSKVLEVVRNLKSHPALMFWSVGNELDHIPGNKAYNVRIWQRLNELAVAIKEIDPAHPVLTVVGTGRMETKIREIASGCPDMDLLGLNAYGDIQKAAGLVRQHWPKPYVVSEWGPTGHWEVPKTPWRVPIEQTSSEKARVIDERYRNVILADRERCLGSFVFYWSEKQETTHTWYGLFCQGLRTESIDVMQRHWTGAWPANRAPQIQALLCDSQTPARFASFKPGQRAEARVAASDPEQDTLSYEWDIRPEVVIPPGSYAGGLETPVKPIEGLIGNPRDSAIQFVAPETPGPYRLFVTVRDGQGNIGYANLPFSVEVSKQ